MFRKKTSNVEALKAAIEYVKSARAHASVGEYTVAKLDYDAAAGRRGRHSLSTRESSAWVAAMKCVGDNSTSEQGFTSFLDDCDLAGASAQRRRELQTRLLRLMQVAGPERAAALSEATIQRMLCLLFADTVRTGAPQPPEAATAA